MEDEVFTPSVMEVVFLAIIAVMLLVLTGTLSAYRRVKKVFVNSGYRMNKAITVQ